MNITNSYSNSSIMSSLRDCSIFLFGMFSCFILLVITNNLHIIQQQDQQQEHGHKTFMNNISNKGYHFRKLSDEKKMIITSIDTDQLDRKHHRQHIGKKYFIDFGANTGDSIKHFLKKDKNISPSALYNYDIKGLGSDGDWHIVTVEANPTHTEWLEYYKAEYLFERKVKSFELFAATAIFTSNTNMSFYLDNKEKGADGSSLYSNSYTVKPHNNSITIKQIDVYHLFHKILHLRKDDYVVLKIDIEGSEFEVLRRIISHGLLPFIDILAVEWHDENYWFTGPDEKLKEILQKQHECINWIIADTNITNIAWHR